MPTTKTPKPRRKRSENLDLERMRRLYEAMTRCSRAVRDSAARARLGTEVPALLEMRGGDVVVLSRVSPAMQLLAGAQPPRKPATIAAPASLLAVQLGLASGIALRMRDEQRRGLVAVFADNADRNAWRDALSLASERKLPLLFFLISRDSGLETLLADANAAGVAPTIVDASDSLAVYRVCQEAQMRARTGDGPAFSICYLPRVSARPDPLASLRTFLAEHKYPLDEWQSSLARRTARRRVSRKPRGKKRRTKSPTVTSPVHVLTIRR
jgi:hypothetical protein